MQNRIFSSMAAETCTYFVAFCPLGEQCSWKGKRLGRFLSDSDAREKIKWHLWASSNHEHDEAEAAMAAETADVMTEEDEEPQAKGKGKAAKSSKAKVNKYEPYKVDKTEAYQYWDKTEKTGSYAIVAATNPVPGTIGESIAALTRAEASARTASRVARAAALAFEEEAAIMATVVKKLQDCL